METRVKSRIPKYAPARAGIFCQRDRFLAAIRRNRLRFQWNMPDLLKTPSAYSVIILSLTTSRTFTQAVSSLAEVTNDAGITLIPVYTNIRDLDRDTNFFLYESISAYLCAVAHAFAERITTVVHSLKWKIFLQFHF